MSYKTPAKRSIGDIFITFIPIRYENTVHMSLAEVPISVSWLGQS